MLLCCKDLQPSNSVLKLWLEGRTEILHNWEGNKFGYMDSLQVYTTGKNAILFLLIFP